MYCLMNTADQEEVWNLGMSFPGNLTCLPDIFHSNTITFANFMQLK